MIVNPALTGLKPSFNEMGAFFLNPDNPLNRGLVGEWLCNELGGTTAVNITRGKNAALTSGAVLGSPTSAGSGLYLPGDPNCAVATYNPLSGFPFALTARIILPSTAVTAFGISYASKDSNVQFYGIGYTSEGQGYLYVRASVPEEKQLAGGTVSIGKAQHLAAVLLSNTVKHMYINGALVATMTESVSFASGTNVALGVMNRSSPFGFMTGTILQASVYDRGLSAAEVAQLANYPYGTPDNPRLIVPSSRTWFVPGEVPPAGAIEKTAQDTLADDINDVLNAILALRSSGAALTDDLNA